MICDNVEEKWENKEKEKREKEEKVQHPKYML